MISFARFDVEHRFKLTPPNLSGAAACQVLESIHPGQVALHKVKFDARFDYEWVNNYKVLQTAFDKIGIERRLDVQALLKGKRMDNLEFVQVHLQFLLKCCLILHYNEHSSE
tara:strand:- start:159 stop:494 length:336 start_codon:yes stop_codon:yes gene_type:complete